MQNQLKMIVRSPQLLARIVKQQQQVHAVTANPLPNVATIQNQPKTTATENKEEQKLLLVIQIQMISHVVAMKSQRNFQQATSVKKMLILSIQ